VNQKKNTRNPVLKDFHLETLKALQKFDSYTLVKEQTEAMIQVKKIAVDISQSGKGFISVISHNLKNQQQMQQQLKQIQANGTNSFQRHHDIKSKKDQVTVAQFKKVPPHAFHGAMDPSPSFSPSSLSSSNSNLAKAWVEQISQLSLFVNTLATDPDKLQLATAHIFSMISLLSVFVECSEKVDVYVGFLPPPFSEDLIKAMKSTSTPQKENSSSTSHRRSYPSATGLSDLTNSFSMLNMGHEKEDLLVHFKPSLKPLSAPTDSESIAFQYQVCAFNCVLQNSPCRLSF
jgi:hypothetical protein